MAAATDYRKIIADIRAGKINPVYVLVGQETYFIDLIVAELEKRVVTPEDRDFNYNLYYGSQTVAESVVNCAQQFPVMADRKLVILKESQAMANAKNELDKFVQYVANPNMTTVLVITFTGEKTAATANLQKAAAKSEGIVFKSESPRDYQLPAYVKDYCQQHKISIDDKAVSMLCEYIGAPLSKLFGELGKLIQIKGGKGRISPEDVEKNVGISKDYNNWELLKAVINRDYPKCCAIIKYFRNNPKNNPTIVTGSVLFNYFAKLTVAHFLPSKDDSSLMAALEAKNAYSLGDYKTGLKTYSPAKAVNAIHHLREFDAKNKGIGSFGNEYDLLQELIFKIMT